MPYLPPVVISVIGQDRDLLSTLARDKAALADFAKTTANATLGADAKPLDARIAAANAQLLSFAKQVASAKLGADSKPFWTEIAAIRAELASMPAAELKVRLSGLSSSLVGAELDKLLAGAGGGDKGPGLGRGLGLGTGLLGMAGFGTLAGLGGLGAEHLLTTLLGVGGSAVGGLAGGGLLGLGSAGVMGVGMGTDMAGMGQAVGDVKAYTAAQDKLNRAIAIYGANSTQARAAQYDLNQTMEGWLPITQQAIAQTSATASQFHTLFDQLTGQAEATGANILTQIMQVGEKFLPTIGKFAAENMQIIQKSLQPLFSWLQGPGLAIFNQLEQTFQDHLPTAMHAFTQGLELLLRTLGLIAPQTGRLTAAIDRWVTKMNGVGWDHYASEVNKLIGLFRTWEQFILAIGRTIADIFKPAVGAGQTLIQVLTDLLGKLDKWLTSSNTKGNLGSLFGAHMSEIKALGADLAAALPALEGFATAYMKMATGVTRYAMVPLLNALAGALKDLSHIPFVGALVGWALAMGLVAKQAGPLVTIITGLPGKVTALVQSIVRFGPAAVSAFETAALKGMYLWDSISSGTSATIGWLGRTVGALGSFLASGTRVFVGLIQQGAAWVAQQTAQLARSIAGFVAWAATTAARVIATAAVWVASNVAMAAAATAAFIAENAATLGIVAALAAVVAAIVYLATHWGQSWADIKHWAADAYHFIDDILHNKFVQMVLAPIAPLLILALHWKTIWADAKAVLTDAWHVIKAIFDAIIRAIDDVVSAVGKLTSALGAVGKVGGGIIHTAGSILSDINPFAEGGLVTKPTLALIGEGGGPELVLPLNDPSRMAALLAQARPYIPPMPSAGGGGSSVPGGGAGGGVNISMPVNVTVPPGTTNPQQIGTAVQRAVQAEFTQFVRALRGGVL